MAGATGWRRHVSQGLPGRVIAALRDPAVSFHDESPTGEPRLLAYAFGTSLMLTLARIGSELVAPGVTAGPDGAPWIAAQFLAGLSFLPLSLYGVAALLRVICRQFGGTGGWADTRLAFFWSGLVCGPIALVAHIVGTAGAGAGFGNAAAGLVWIWFLSPMLAAAHGFSRWTVLLGFVIVAACVFALSAFG